jgi:2-oxoglutarate dehydrogenase E1 component
MDYREEKDIENTAIIRIEQLYPFHRELVEAIVSQYPHASHFVWCQEEPLNMGAWSYIWPRLDRAVGVKVRYAGRADRSGARAPVCPAGRGWSDQRGILALLTCSWAPDTQG